MLTKSEKDFFQGRCFKVKCAYEDYLCRRADIDVEKKKRAHQTSSNSKRKREQERRGRDTLPRAV